MCSSLTIPNGNGPFQNNLLYIDGFSRLNRDAFLRYNLYACRRVILNLSLG
jgi:hypothetical protein